MPNCVSSRSHLLCLFKVIIVTKLMAKQSLCRIRIWKMIPTYLWTMEFWKRSIWIINHILWVKYILNYCVWNLFLALTHKPWEVTTIQRGMDLHNSAQIIEIQPQPNGNNHILKYSGEPIWRQKYLPNWAEWAVYAKWNLWIGSPEYFKIWLFPSSWGSISIIWAELHRFIPLCIVVTSHGLCTSIKSCKHFLKKITM